ncbi:MAG: fasciclin domain-containing protein, partial [Bacteroidota bacterium]
MIFRYKRLVVLTAGVCMLFVLGCKKLTDEHNAITDTELGNNLSEMVSANSNLSTFAGYLKQTGLDSVIASSRTYTVFAPVNAALVGLDPAIVGNPEKLKKFVRNHIASELIPATGNAARRILMLSGKYHNLVGSKIETANITVADKYASNGLLQVIDKPLP